MTRAPYDLAAKALFTAEYGGAGRVVVEHELAGEPQYVDVFFERDHERPVPAGLLGRVAERSCLIEAFHEPPGVELARDALCKQPVMHRSRRKSAPSEPIVPMWIVSASRPTSVIDGFALRRRRGWPRGVYTAADAAAWNVIVVSELPRTSDTLTARLLGAGETLRHAIRDWHSLPSEAQGAHSGGEVLRVLRSSGRLPDDPVERAIVMEAIETYEEYLRRLEGLKREGLEQGLAPLVRLFERKLGRALTADERVRVVERLHRLGPERLGDVALDLDPATLSSWLADPAAS